MLCVTRRNSTSQSPIANALARLNRHEAIAGIDAVLLELRPQERQRQRPAVDRSVDQRPDIGDAADVIFVAMRQQQRGRARLALLQIGQVRNQQVDAGQLRSGEHHAGVDDERRPLGRHGHRVHAEFAEPAERDNLYRWSHSVRRRLGARIRHVRPGRADAAVRIYRDAPLDAITRPGCWVLPEGEARRIAQLTFLPQRKCRQVVPFQRSPASRAAGAGRCGFRRSVARWGPDRCGKRRQGVRQCFSALGEHRANHPLERRARQRRKQRRPKAQPDDG